VNGHAVPSPYYICAMQLGVFSISLAVKDVVASKSFYEKLGFVQFAGSLESKYVMMKNGDCIIGLFQGMFPSNILTFNPGWDGNAQNVDPFEDIRGIQKQLRSQGITLAAEADETTTGPASLMVVDPDGNTILLDQHR
jgi:catechol 2,3-dioxygenase-like lactoylglutathione lyase family enzyme